MLVRSVIFIFMYIKMNTFSYLNIGCFFGYSNCHHSVYLLKIIGQLELAYMLGRLAGLCFTRILLRMLLHVSATGQETLSDGLAFQPSSQIRHIVFLQTGTSDKNSATW